MPRQRIGDTREHLLALVRMKKGDSVKVVGVIFQRSRNLLGQLREAEIDPVSGRVVQECFIAEKTEQIELRQRIFRPMVSTFILFDLVSDAVDCRLNHRSWRIPGPVHRKQIPHAPALGPPLPLRIDARRQLPWHQRSHPAPRRRSNHGSSAVRPPDASREATD